MIVDEPEKPVNEADVPMDEEVEEDPLKVAFDAIELDTSSAPSSKERRGLPIRTSCDRFSCRSTKRERYR